MSVSLLLSDEEISAIKSMTEGALRSVAMLRFMGGDSSKQEIEVLESIARKLGITISTDFVSQTGASSDEIQQKTDKMMEISAALLEQNSTRFERIFTAALTGLCSGMNFADGEEYRITRTVAEAINIANTAEQQRKKW